MTIDIGKLKAFKKDLEKKQVENEMVNLQQLEGHPQYNLVQKAKRKEKLTVEEQIEYLKLKGIKFDHIDEEEAKEYLSLNTYYYKVTAYRKNFSKNNENKYQDLDFATLKDLAIIDMHLRYLLIQLSLDIEHAIKTKLINLITESDEDGYSIVEEYNDYQFNSIDNHPKLSDEEKEERKNNYIHSSNNILKDSKNPHGYHRDLYDKHNHKPSIWVLIEVMSYGQLSSFLKFYVEKQKFNYKPLKNASEFLHFSKNIRDSAAHSRPILLDIVQSKEIFHPKQRIRNYLYDTGIPKPIANKYLTYVKVHDLCSLMYLHDNYIKGIRARRERKKELVTLFKRAKKKKELYPDTTELGEILLVLGTLVKQYKC